MQPESTSTAPRTRRLSFDLYALTRWEDLSLTLAPELAATGKDPERMGRRPLESWIDSRSELLAEPNIGDGAARKLAEHGGDWRAVARLIRREKERPGHGGAGPAPEGWN